ncbi:SWIM zinc finger family protein [Pirellulaceae bacterium SH449]
MSLTTSKIAELAPDQESLNAAHKLMKPGKWPALRKHNDLVWGECQGSGANPYRTVFDHSNAGYKCTCPSRKFPCKHVLALMWMYVQDPGPFADGEVPPWVADWLGRRRNPAASSSPKPNEKKAKTAAKSLITAEISASQAPLDPSADDKRKAASEKRSLATQQSIATGLEELQQWLNDQVRGGLSGFLNDPVSRCRTIAARLVDAKAQAMASRLDELPSRLKQLPSELRLDALLQELSRIILICRAWQATPADAELTRLVGSSETRDSIISLVDGLRVQSIWEVVGEQITTRRDGLVSQATWLMNLGLGTRFALLLDYFPASLGKRSSTFTIGEVLAAELSFYPARQPLRAIIAERQSPTDESLTIEITWPTADGNPLDTYRMILQKAPWMVDVPLLLPRGRIAHSGAVSWWQAVDGSLALPVSGNPGKHLAGLVLEQTAAIWDGISLTMLSGQSNWGKWANDS